jgi:ADP-heptose:LPS heptosyltransferase/GT2 family glycosyltransferase
VSVSPKTVLYLRPDTIGDIVLFTPTLEVLMAEWPQARHVILVRRGYEALAPLFPPELDWLVTDLNPFKQRPLENRPDLESLISRLEALEPDLIIAPTLNRTWLELAVADHFKDSRSVALGHSGVDPIFAASLKLDLGIASESPFKEAVRIDPSATDVENQRHLVEALLGRKIEARLPSVRVGPDYVRKARSLLAENGLQPGFFAAVFTGGLANVPLKAWPSKAFGVCIAHLQRVRKVPVLLMAHESEKEDVAAASAETVKAGGVAPAFWLGEEGSLPLLAALLGESALYVGHDTGAMHLAGAVGRPVIGIFGGGHWPRFRPAARQSVSVVQPLPCFGCNWDCHFDDGPCVKTIPASEVVAAIDHVLAHPNGEFASVRECQALPVEAVRLIASATPGILHLKRDRIERQHKIEELKDETDFKDTEIRSIKKAAEERKAEMESIKAELEQECADKDKEIDELKAETDSKDTEITDLKKAAEDRKTEMESIKAELEEECADKDKEIGELKAEADSKDSEITDLKVTCNEREQLVIRLDGGLREHIRAAGLRETRIKEVEAERDAVTATLKKLPPDASDWAKGLHDKDVHIGNLEAMLRERDEQIRSLSHANSNYAAGFGNLELAKHYGRLLGEKEGVIRELHQACVEREVVINQLAGNATRATSWIRKLWLVASLRLREGVWRPLDRWLFRKVVEDYWMQIGILRQYEPRPISWDRRLAKAPRANGSLPKIGVVTPSYAQPAFIESTILSVLNQNYPKLLYVIQDGASPDASAEIISKYASRLKHWVSEADHGQADAVRRGFSHIETELGADDVMAWFNSDDLLAPRAMKFVASYFAAHPDVDVIYGHRIIIDEADREIGRWIMPRHEADSLEWIDYVPQETLFWRKRAWDLVGGIDPSFQFALDWDLLARFRQAGCRIVRLPYFLGCFRVHAQQKTTQVIHTTGALEMAHIRARFHGKEKDNHSNIERHARRIRFRGALTARLHAAGIRW